MESLFTVDKMRSKNRDKVTKPQRKRVWASLKAGKDSLLSDVKEEINRRDSLGDKLLGLSYYPGTGTPIPKTSLETFTARRLKIATP